MDDVVSGERVCPPETLMRKWDLPESDRRALAEWGLPLDSRERPDIQEESGPVLVPNVAGEQERRLISPDQRLYKLINMSVGPVKQWIGAAAGEGRVLMIRPAPVTVNDLHPQLRPYHPGYYAPAVGFVNSSVAQFVEITWRWHAAREVLLALPAPDYGSEAKTQEAFDALHAAHIEQVRRRERIVLEHIERIDSRVCLDDQESYWRATVVDKYVDY